MSLSLAGTGAELGPYPDGLRSGIAPKTAAFAADTASSAAQAVRAENNGPAKQRATQAIVLMRWVVHSSSVVSLIPRPGLGGPSFVALSV